MNFLKQNWFELSVIGLILVIGFSYLSSQEKIREDNVRMYCRNEAVLDYSGGRLSGEGFSLKEYTDCLQEFNVKPSDATVSSFIE